MSQGLTAVVLAGGLGTRMRPLTATRPKHLIEVAGEPLVEHQLRWLAGHGVARVVLATSYLADQFPRVLGDGSRFGVELRYIREEEPLGTGGALALAAADMGDDAVFVAVNGDLHTRHDLGAQLGRLDPGTDVVLHVRTVADARPFGAVVVDVGGTVRRLVEKSPAPPSREVNGGTYVVRRGALRLPPGARASFERDVLPPLVAAGRAAAYREQAAWADVGSPAALVEVSRALVLEQGRDCLVHPGAEVDPTAHVGDGTSIGDGARVGPGATVAGSILMADSRVGAGAVVESSVLGRGASVGPGAHLRGVALGDDERRPT